MKIITTLKNLDFTKMEEMLSEKGYNSICGVDEVGRGPLAGPVVAAAVIIPLGIKIEGLNDSKKLSAPRREILFDDIINSEAICAIGIIDNQSIDTLNILRASLMAMRKAVSELDVSPDFVLVDGNQPIPQIVIPQFSIVSGDALCKSIQAASIIAKVTRDRIMCKYEKLYPTFSFSKHKGYPTKEHISELRQFGITDIHRKSFRPVAEIVQEQQTLV